MRGLRIHHRPGEAGRPLLIAAAALLLALLLALVPAAPAGARPDVVLAAAAAPTLVCPIPSADADRPATELRVALGRLLGEHAYLLVQAMRSAATDAPDQAAFESRLDANSDDLAAAVGAAYGAEAGTSFRALWQRHIDAAAAFARATASGETAARDAALADLEAFRRDLDAFLQGANPKLDAEEEAHAVRLHLDQLVAYAQGDFSTAYRAAREAYGHMFALGDSLARAISQQDPASFPDAKVAFSPASALRLKLDQLLGEHLILAAEAMRAGLDDAPTLPAARQALDGNTADLAAAVAGIYGDEGGTAFSEVWSAHLVAYLEYIDAVRSGDQARQQAARSTLEGYGRVLGDFLGDVNPNLPPEAVSELVTHHTTALLTMVDQYRAGDYEAALATVSGAYEHMFTVGGALATAIATQFPDRFKDIAELPPTDATGRGSHRSVAWPLVVVLGGTLVALFAGEAWRSRRRTGRSRAAR